MTVLGSSDLLRVRFSGLIADYDKDTLVNLYQPIIGYTAMAIYFSLWSLSKSNENEYLEHESLFNRMQIAPGRFIESRKLLEATGLLKSYVRTIDGIKKYSYILYAPKAPKDFFNNTLLYGMLIKCIGLDEVKLIKNNYKDNNNEDIGEEISEKFNEAFKPDYADPVFMFAINQKEKTIGRNVATVQSSFDYDIFFKSFSKDSLITEKKISTKEMKEIERLAILNGINQELAAKLIEDIFDYSAPKGKQINLLTLSELFQEQSNMMFVRNIKGESKKPNLTKGTSNLASKINLMETVSPKDYLSILQNGCAPAKSDLKLINDISSKFYLSNCVINAVVDFVLASNNNILSRPYMEKIAASLAREGVLTTIDAMNYLRKVSKSRKQNDREEFVAKKSPVVQTKSKIKETKTDDSISWNELIDQIDLEEHQNAKA